MGTSSHADSDETAIAEGRNAAMEALVYELALRVGTATWAHDYEGTRAGDLAELAEAQAHGSENLDAARDHVRAAQAAVVESLERRHTLAVEMDRYWEQYSAPGDEAYYVGFVRIRLPVGNLEALEADYSTRHKVLGAEVVDFFPGSAWRYQDVRAGATIVSVGPGELNNFGLAGSYVVLSVQGEAVETGRAFAEVATAEFDRKQRDGGAVRLVVKTGDTMPLIYNKPIRNRVIGPPHPRGRRTPWMGDFPPHPTPPGWNDDPTQRNRDQPPQ